MVQNAAFSHYYSLCPCCLPAPHIGEVRDKPIVGYVGDTAVILCKMEESKPKPSTWNWYRTNGTNKVGELLRRHGFHSFKRDLCPLNWDINVYFTVTFCYRIIGTQMVWFEAQTHLLCQHTGSPQEISSMPCEIGELLSLRVKCVVFGGL